MSTLSTHILDTMHGRPAAGVAVALATNGGEMARGVTDADGRCADLISGPLASGRYVLSFAVGDYFRAAGVALTDPPFLDVIAIQFGIDGNRDHYHVPLLVSPYSYSTYLGS